MRGTLGELAALSLSHDSAAALAGIEELVAARESHSDAAAVLAFVQVLNCQFDAATGWLPVAEGPLSGDIVDFVSAVCLAQVPVAVPVRPEPEYAGLHSFVTVEKAMSAGQIADAEIAARALAPALEDLAGGTYAAWNQVALARSLAFQGRVTEARDVVDGVLADPRRDGWPAVCRIARGVQAFVAAHAGEFELSSRFTASLGAEPDEPRTYLESAAFVLAAFAEQAAGRLGVVEALLMRGGGGEFLPRFQVVDRVYAYEILVEAALAEGDPASAVTWLELAEALPIDAHDMASAAVARCRARIAIALDDPETGARESVASQYRAALVGGSLEVLRAQLLQAAAARGSAAGPAAEDVDGLEDIARLAASTGARVVREWAVRELSLRGRRLRNVPGQGWEALTARQRLVAVLAAQGLRNKEIAARLFISERTVEGHIAAVLDALGAPSRVRIGQHLPETAAPGADLSVLTPRQSGVAALVAAGRSNAEIAAELGISEKTVEKHLADLFGRLGVQSRTAVAAAVRQV